MEQVVVNLKRTLKSALQEAEVQIDAQQRQAADIFQRLQSARDQLAHEESHLGREQRELDSVEVALQRELEEVSRLREEVDGRGFFACCMRPAAEATEAQQTVLVADPGTDALVEGRSRADALEHQ
eukprot:SRR837773.7299.p1 GENE.SRR837773.7299~~SRR837773.7299.p1  ORF type:complete len:126 (-),score=29.84 SRR837773.7299:168-545(-)